MLMSMGSGLVVVGSVWMPVNSRLSRPVVVFRWWHLHIGLRFDCLFLVCLFCFWVSFVVLLRFAGRFSFVTGCMDGWMDGWMDGMHAWDGSLAFL